MTKTLVIKPKKDKGFQLIADDIAIDLLDYSYQTMMTCRFNT